MERTSVAAADVVVSPSQYLLEWMDTEWLGTSEANFSCAIHSS